MQYVYQLFSHLEKSQYSDRQRWALEELTGCLESQQYSDWSPS